MAHFQVTCSALDVLLGPAVATGPVETEAVVPGLRVPTKPLPLSLQSAHTK